MHDLVVRDLEQAWNRTLGLTDLDDPTLVTQYDARWCGTWGTSASRRSCGCCGPATRPGPGCSRQRRRRF